MLQSHNRNCSIVFCTLIKIKTLIQMKINMNYILFFRRIFILTIFISFYGFSNSLKAQSVDNCDELTGWFGGT